MELRGKVALVTGGAHRVGRAIVLALAGRGASIALHYGSSEDAARRTAGEVAALGVEAWPLQADLSRPDEIDALFAAAAAKAGRLDILVNSAASFRRRGFDEITAEEWDAVQAVNTRAPFLCSQRAATLIRRSRRPGGEAGLIVNLIDLASTLAWRGYAHHAVSKAGLRHLTAVAARELAPEVRVNAVMPGAVLPPPGLEAASDGWREMGERLPVGRTGSPEQVGHAVVFLAENDFITGIVVPVDGGEHLLGAGHR